MSEKRWTYGGNGSHWDGCAEVHWDCKIAQLEAENAASQERIEDLELRLDVYNGNMYDVVVLENERLRSENAALREQVRWIPVSERLPELKTYASREDIIICPEDYTIVITVDDKGYVSPAYFSYDGMFLDDYEMPAEPMVYGKTLFFSECLDYSSEIINNVTHWMPLPQPPEVE